MVPDYMGRNTSVRGFPTWLRLLVRCSPRVKLGIEQRKAYSPVAYILTIYGFLSLDKLATWKYEPASWMLLVVLVVFNTSCRSSGSYNAVQSGPFG